MSKKRSLWKQFGPDAYPVLSGMILDQAEKLPMPKRFMMKVGTAPNNVNIYDTVTGKTLNVGLCDLFGARMALCAFCGDD